MKCQYYVWFLIPSPHEPRSHLVLISVQCDILPFWVHHNPPISLLTLIIYCTYYTTVITWFLIVMVVVKGFTVQTTQGSVASSVTSCRRQVIEHILQMRQRPMLSKLYRWVISYLLFIWYQSPCMTVFWAMPMLQQGLSIWPFPHYLWPMQEY